jgi:hypothetical protein
VKCPVSQSLTSSSYTLYQMAKPRFLHLVQHKATRTATEPTEVELKYSRQNGGKHVHRKSKKKREEKVTNSSADSRFTPTSFEQHANRHLNYLALQLYAESIQFYYWQGPIRINVFPNRIHRLVLRTHISRSCNGQKMLSQPLKLLGNSVSFIGFSVRNMSAIHGGGHTP